MQSEDISSMKERAIHCLYMCNERGKANCFECESQVVLEEIIELCRFVEETGLQNG